MDIDEEIALDNARDEFERLKTVNAQMLEALKTIHNMAAERVAPDKINVWSATYEITMAAIAAAEPEADKP